MGIIDNVKDIAELIKKYNNVELNRKIIDLRDEIFELRENNLKLKEENKISEKIVFEKPYYWLKDGLKKDGPYCQKCYDDNKKLIRLQEMRDFPGCWKCSVCKCDFTDSSYKPNNFDSVHNGGSSMSS